LDFCAIGSFIVLTLSFIHLSESVFRLNGLFVQTNLSFVRAAEWDFHIGLSFIRVAFLFIRPAGPICGRARCPHRVVPKSL